MFLEVSFEGSMAPLLCTCGRAEHPDEGVLPLWVFARSLLK